LKDEQQTGVGVFFFFLLSFSPSLLFPTHPPDVVQLALVGDFPAAGLGDLEDCFFFFFVEVELGCFSFLSAVPPRADRLSLA
jgi:hypothetical protein